MTIPQGALRFNTDSMKLEYYRGGPVGFGTTTQTGEWVNITTDSPDIQTGGARGVFGGGFASPVNVNTIDYITISTTGNAIEFGVLTQALAANRAACSSSTRGVFGGGITVPANVVTNVIDYVQISTLGTALDFGDLTIARRTRTGAVSSPTRGVFLGGTAPGGFFNVIEFVTIASTGDAVDFGDSLFSGAYRTGCSNAVRGLFGGGYAPPVAINTIEYLTIATTGNATYFGDLTATYTHPSACSSSTRGVFGGDTVPLLVNSLPCAGHCSLSPNTCNSAPWCVHCIQRAVYSFSLIR